VNLQTTYLGLSLAHPVVAGASPLSATLDGMRRLEDAGAAAIVTASFFEEEVAAEQEALEAARTVGAESHPEVTSYLPPLCGCRGPQAGHIETIRRAAESLSVPVIASLHATTRKGWIGGASDLQAAGAAAIELNMFQVSADLEESCSDVEKRLVDIVREIRGTVEIPIAVKLGPNHSALLHLAAMLADARANGIVLFNRLYEPDIDLETLTFRPTLALSTRSDMRLPLRWIALLHGKTPLSLAASGGVEDADEVVKYLLAGADVVQSASVLLRDGPERLAGLVQGLVNWLEAHGAASVAEIRGRVSANRIARPEALLCGQHFRTLLRECPCGDCVTGAVRR
jgi:dihydroorotate dehydrogenase (fumarate)